VISLVFIILQLLIEMKQSLKKINANRKGMKLINDGPSHPPALKGVELTHNATFRFIAKTASATSGTQITYQNLLDLFVVATGATTGNDLFQAVKLRRVRIWGPAGNASSGSNSVTVGCEFNGTGAAAIGDQQVHTDTSMSTQPAYIDCKPARMSQAAQWQIYTGGGAMILDYPAGAVIDVTLSLRANLATANSGVQNPLVGGVAGSQYLRGLDGQPTSTSVFTVVPAYAQN